MDIDEIKGIAQVYMSMQEKAKYPHMMYDPKTGKEVEAKTPEDHAKYAKMGYTHEKPKSENNYIYAAKMAKKKGEKTFTLAGKTYEVEAVLKSDKLDPVNPKAVKKKFKDRKDKDIDNDGDVDGSDEYLHKKRQAISKSMGEGLENLTPEELTEYFDDLNEISMAMKRQVLQRAKDRADRAADRDDKLQSLKLKKKGTMDVDSKSAKAIDTERDRADKALARLDKKVRKDDEKQASAADEKGVLNKDKANMTRSAKRKDAQKRTGRDVLNPGQGRKQGSVGGAERNLNKVDALYKKYREGGGKLSKTDYLSKFGSRIKREDLEEDKQMFTYHIRDVMKKEGNIHARSRIEAAVKARDNGFKPPMSVIAKGPYIPEEVMHEDAVKKSHDASPKADMIQPESDGANAKAAADTNKKIKDQHKVEVKDRPDAEKQDGSDKTKKAPLPKTLKDVRN